MNVWGPLFLLQEGMRRLEIRERGSQSDMVQISSDMLEEKPVFEEKRVMDWGHQCSRWHQWSRRSGVEELGTAFLHEARQEELQSKLLWNNSQLFYKEVPSDHPHERAGLSLVPGLQSLPRLHCMLPSAQQPSSLRPGLKLITRPILMQVEPLLCASWLLHVPQFPSGLHSSENCVGSSNYCERFMEYSSSLGLAHCSQKHCCTVIEVIQA